MNQTNVSDFKGYETQALEKKIDNLEVTGDLPLWLQGSFVSNGPAQFEVGKTHFNNWFDGFAMLKKFDFAHGRLSFQNRYLQSDQYVKSNAAKKLYSDEFATYASPSLVGRLANIMKSLFQPGLYDNCNVNTMQIADRYLAMTESSTVVEFKLDDLSTVGHFKFDDKMVPQMSTAHPHWDADRNEIITVNIEIGKDIQYHVCKIAANSTKREIIKSFVSDNLFYMHSFSITPNYVILFKSPLVLSKWKLMLGLPFDSALSWIDNDVSKFIIIDRKSGEQIEIESDPFVCLHSSNAYEAGDEIILDLVCYKGGHSYSDVALNNLRSPHPELDQSNLRRFVLNTNAKSSQQTVISSDCQEFPRIHYDLANGKKYEFVYTNVLEPSARFFNAIQKMNVQSGKTITWKKADYYLGEPVFVPKPSSQTEDEGVVLSIAYNASTQKSSLIVLDAMSLQQIAEAELPLYLPFGLHGNFFQA